MLLEQTVYVMILITFGPLRSAALINPGQSLNRGGTVIPTEMMPGVRSKASALPMEVNAYAQTLSTAGQATVAVSGTHMFPPEFPHKPRSRQLCQPRPLARQLANLVATLQHIHLENLHVIQLVSQRVPP